MEKKNLELKKCTEKILKKSLVEFKNYDLVGDCINPLTGSFLVEEKEEITERYRIFRKNEIDYDADSSLEAMALYKLAFKFLKKRENMHVEKQSCYNRFGLKYFLKAVKGEGRLIGDTMNTVGTTLLCFYKINGDKASLPDEMLTLMAMYHTPGNFILIPSKPGVSPNSERGIGKAQDYMDLYLTAVYDYYTGMYPDWNLETMFKSKEAAELMEEYLDGFKKAGKPSWDAFVEDNYLQPYVAVRTSGEKKSYGEPVELWPGHIINTVRTGKSRPRTGGELLCYLIKAAELIEARAELMFKGIHGVKTSFEKMDVRQIYCALDTYTDGGYHFDFADIGSDKRGFLILGDEELEVGRRSYIVLQKKGEAKREFIKVPFAKKNNRWEFDVFKFLEGRNIKYSFDSEAVDCVGGSWRDVIGQGIWSRRGNVRYGSYKEWFIDCNIENYWINAEFYKDSLFIDNKPVADIIIGSFDESRTGLICSLLQNLITYKSNYMSKEEFMELMQKLGTYDSVSNFVRFRTGKDNIMYFCGDLR